MTIRVRYFASLADRAGVRSETVDLDGVPDVTALWTHLVSLHPALAGSGSRPLAACDMEYAPWDRALTGVREVAFLPPVSGG